MLIITKLIKFKNLLSENTIYKYFVEISNNMSKTANFTYFKKNYNMNYIKNSNIYYN